MSKWIPVLVIEDDKIIREAIKRSLKIFGFYSYTAKDGETGIKLALEKKPTFILLDWMLPETDGMEILSELKHNKKTENIPVFMLTGKGMIGDVDQAFEVGADDYITKPLDIMTIGRIVKAKWSKFKNKVNAP